MKKLLAILVVATMLASVFAMTPVLSAATADLVVDSAEGTPTVDGVKDDAYGSAKELVMNQCGKDNGEGAVLDTPAALAYVVNDADYVYAFVSVTDSELDNTNANVWEQDSVELFFMSNNSKVQWRVHYDGSVEADSGTTPVEGTDYAVVLTDKGYDVEIRFPITDVLNNEIEMVLQINSATEGKRTATVHIAGHTDGDNAYQRNTRQDVLYDSWWTLKLTGEHEDTRVDPVEEADELTAKNYQNYLSRSLSTGSFVQDQVTWSVWHVIGSGPSAVLGETVDVEMVATPTAADTINADNTSNFSVLPKFRIQITDNAMVENESGHYVFTLGDIVITAEGYENVVIPSQTVDTRMTCTMADWGLTGQTYEIEMAETVVEQLGITKEEFCTQYLTSVTGITTTLTYDSYNLITKEDLDAFVDNLTAMEQEWIDTDTTLAEQLEKANNALASAQGASEDTSVLETALKDANNAKNRSNKARESAGWVEGGLADTYINETFDGIISQIQELVDAAAPATTPDDTTPDDTTPDDTDKTPTDDKDGGSNTGLIVGIIAVIVVIVGAVVGVVLGKKKK